jgi:assimilatory nitrate reductase catalytic subunit
MANGKWQMDGGRRGILSAHAERREGRYVCRDFRTNSSMVGRDRHILVPSCGARTLRRFRIEKKILITAPPTRSSIPRFEALRAHAATYWPERVERITGVPQREIIAAARMLGTARTALVLTARGAEQQSQGVGITLAYINLALALGKVGLPNSGYGCLTGQGNGGWTRARAKGRSASRLSAPR